MSQPPSQIRRANLNTVVGNKQATVCQSSMQDNQALNDAQPVSEKMDSSVSSLSALPFVATKKTELVELFDVAACPVVVKSDTATNKEVASQRLALYQTQYQRTRRIYQAPESIRPTYLVQLLKQQFDEYQHYQMSVELDKRGVVDADDVHRLWQQLHVVDDIISELVQTMPAQRPVGWQISSQGRNYLRLPTVGRLRITDPVADQTSLNSYVLGHFGVMSFTYDKGYYIGHILGYLFSCYYFAHLSIGYGVTALPKNAVPGYEYASLQTPHLVRLLHTLDVRCKQRVYQLAVICAKLSHQRTDKRIEKMLIAEVNDFDKKLQQKHLDMLLTQGLMPEVYDNPKNSD